MTSQSDLEDDATQLLLQGDFNVEQDVPSTSQHDINTSTTAPSLPTIFSAYTTTLTNKDPDMMEEHKCCRICGEGEDDEETDDMNMYDEESWISDPMLSTTTAAAPATAATAATAASSATATTAITQQNQPRLGFTKLMTSYHSNSTSRQDGVGPSAPLPRSSSSSSSSSTSSSVPVITTTNKRLDQRNHNTKKWIQQKNPLIRPCHCKGTMMYVHVSCLNRWRTMSPRASSYVACDLCGYEYNIYRPRYAAIVTNVHFLRIMTALLVILSIIACAYLCKVVDIYCLGHTPQPDNHDWMELHGPSWLWMDRFYLFAGLIVISMLGIAYLTFLCVARPNELAHLTHSGAMDDSTHSTAGGYSFLCCDQTSCPWYSCYLADFAACSGDAAAGGFLIFVVLMSLLAILFGIVGAVTGVFRLMESVVDRAAGHIKERILDVD